MSDSKEFDNIWGMVEDYVEAEIDIRNPAMDGVAHCEAVMRSNDAWQTLRDKIKSLLEDQ